MSQRRVHSPQPLCDCAVVAMTGSIGVLAAAEFVAQLRAVHRVADVRVVMSPSAASLVTPAAMRAVAGSPVLTDLFDPAAPFGVGHIEISAGADVLIVMPATANIIGKAACGIADDPVSAVILAATCPVVFAPSMNESMWRRPAVQRNLRTLARDGHHVVPPVQGIEVATMQPAYGAMPDADIILGVVRRALGARSRSRRAATRTS